MNKKLIMLITLCPLLSQNINAGKVPFAAKPPKPSVQTTFVKNAMKKGLTKKAAKEAYKKAHIVNLKKAKRSASAKKPLAQKPIKATFVKPKRPNNMPASDMNGTAMKKKNIGTSSSTYTPKNLPQPKVSGKRK